jgi:hypothetical protein
MGNSTVFMVKTPKKPIFCGIFGNRGALNRPVLN